MIVMESNGDDSYNRELNLFVVCLSHFRINLVRMRGNFEAFENVLGLHGNYKEWAMTSEHFLLNVILELSVL